MSIQNLDQLTYRISEATDQLEVAVTAVRESAGVVESGTGESAQSARESAQSAKESASFASVAQQSVVMADSHRQSARAEADRASAYASQASTSAGSSSRSEVEAQKSASTATAQAGIASTKASQATQQAEIATTQAGVASTKADQATQQATIATQQASMAKQAVADAVKLNPSKDGLVEEAPKDNRIYGRVDGAWGLIPTGGGTSGGGTGKVDTVNGIAPDKTGNVTVPIPQPIPQVKSDWNAISGVAEILNKPDLFSGDYNDLTNKPAPVKTFSGSYKDLTDKPTPVTPFSGNYNDLTNRPEIPVVVEQVNPDWNATSGKAQILNKPVLFDGRYESLTGKPTIPTGGGGGGTSNITDNKQLLNGAGYIKDAPTDGKWYARKGGTWAEVVTGKAFSGDYRDLTNKPPLNKDGTVGGSGFNGDYNDLVNKPPLITSNTQIFNGAGYIKDAVADNKQYIRKNHKWEVFDPKSDLGHRLFIEPFSSDKAEEWAGTRLYRSRTLTDDPELVFNNWTHTNPHIPYPLYWLGFMGFERRWKVGGELITPEYFSFLPSGRYSFGADIFREPYFTGHVLAGKTGYIEVVRITKRTHIPTVYNNGGLNLDSTGVAYVIDETSNRIVSIYDFDVKTGEFIARVGDNSGVTPFSGRYIDLAGKPTLFSGNYNDLTNKPVLFSGDYNDLINVPPPSTTGGFSGNYNDLTNKPVLFSGNYNNLTNKPTKLSQFTNDLTITATKVVNKRTGQAMEEWVGTQAQYDAISSKDPNTRYWITEA